MEYLELTTKRLAELQVKYEAIDFRRGNEAFSTSGETPHGIMGIQACLGSVDGKSVLYALPANAEPLAEPVMRRRDLVAEMTRQYGHSARPLTQGFADGPIESFAVVEIPPLPLENLGIGWVALDFRIRDYSSTVVLRFSGGSFFLKLTTAGYLLAASPYLIIY